MKEKPALPDQAIIQALWEAYGLPIRGVEFLPIGDISSAKYRLVSAGPALYFLKLRRAGFQEVALSVPYFLHAQGIRPVLGPLPTTDGRLWAPLAGFSAMLYPFIEGQNGFQRPLSEAHWLEFGAALRQVHATRLPADLERQVPSERFGPAWRERLQGFLEQAAQRGVAGPLAAKLAADLVRHGQEIRHMIRRAQALGASLRAALQAGAVERVLCHTDIHAGNLLLDTRGGLHITDWDDPMLAPKERDLMFIGGGMGGIWNTPREEALFYRGYGGPAPNRAALAYYRYERLVSDITEFCQQILASEAGGAASSAADQERTWQKYASIFSPGQVWEIACRTDEGLGVG